MCGQPVFALEITADFLQKNSVDLSKEALTLHDPDNVFEPEAVAERMSQPDFRSDERMPAGKQYWFYIPLINRTQTARWSIRSDEPLAIELDFYLHCRGQGLQFFPRPALGFDSPNLATTQFVPITLPTDTDCGLLQRARNSLFDAIRISLVPYAEMAWQSNLKTTLALLGMGVVIGLILYNFLLYLSLRNNMYLLYITYAALHLTAAVLISFNPEPLGNLLASSRHVLRGLGNLTIIFFILFTLRFMQPGIQQLRVNPTKRSLFIWVNTFIYIGWLIITLNLLILLATIFYPDSIAPLTRVNNSTYLAALLLVPLISLLVAIGGYKPAWVFLPAWTILAAGHILFVLDGLRIMELQGLGATYAALAAALEMVLLSIALGMTLRDSQKARDRAKLARENAELRMAQQEKFVSTLSHEIRTPLHAMLGSTTLLGRTPLSDKQKDYWNTTHYAAESMYALVDNLLDRTQAKQARLTDKHTVFEPQRLLEAMIRLLRSRAEEKDLSLTLQMEALPNYLDGNPVILRRVLINLISNAVKYTDKGDVTVHATWLAKQSELHVTIKDSGRGMSTQQLRQVHQNFNMGVEALYSQNASSGLGLPICFEMLQEAGGKLELDSQPGQGTSVHFSLPMQLATLPVVPVGVTDNTETAESAEELALVVLVVDDVETNRMVARELLESTGHQVSTAEGGKQALALMQKQDFDAVLSDVRMPEMDGAQLLEQLRRQYSPEELIVVMTSAHFDQQQRSDLLTLGANACLAKPYTLSGLLAALQYPELQNTEATAANTLTNIRKRLGDEKSAQLLTLYQSQLQQDIACISDAANRHDGHNIRVAAHRIVSASLALGLTDNAAAAAQIEHFEEGLSEPDWDAFNQLIERCLPVLNGQSECCSTS
ncbi:MAG: response regulator [Thiolinea sp.]